MLKTVLFDLDGTLLDRDTSLRLFLGQQHARYVAELPGLSVEDFTNIIAGLDAFGHVAKPTVYAQFCERFGFGKSLKETLVEDFEASFHGLAVAFPGLHETLQELRKLGLNLGLVTNGRSRSQRPKIEALKIAPYFTSILISEEQGLRKPDPRIFQLAMQETGSTPESTIFVGDHPEADIRGAARAGLQTVWKRNSCWPAPTTAEATFDDLPELPGLVRALSK